MSVRFYIGTDNPSWLWNPLISHHNLFVSRTRLKKYKKYRPALCDWALDSGAFTELLLNGRWTVTPAEYVDMCRRLQDQCGRIDFCSIMDWMCEEEIIKGGFISGRTAPGTGLTLKDHQKLTVESYFTLSGLEPSINWLPVLQGFSEEEYIDCVRLYESAGLDLRDKWVGVGSVCRRQGTNEIASVLRTLSSLGMRLHGFGVKVQGLEKSVPYLHSADSMAWSYGARRKNLKSPSCTETHRDCRHCVWGAMDWFNRSVAPAIVKGEQQNTPTPNQKGPEEEQCE